jgi:signal transduction histidine kinase
MSHELRTPLNSILGFSDVLLTPLTQPSPPGRGQGEGLTEKQQRWVRNVRSSGEKLLALINDILDLAKIESGRMQIQLETWSLQTLLDEVKGLAMAYPRKAEVELRWPDNLVQIPDVLVDSGRLKQVLLNVLSNALKFTKVGSVSLVVERGFGDVAISVVDTGIGVSQEAMGRLFQKFVQAEGGHAREYGGTGLGLVICKHLMEMMNGSIALTSPGEGKGTTLTLTVPIA